MSRRCPQRHDHHEEDVILYGVNDAVIGDPNPQTWATLQRSGRWRSRVLRKESNCALDTRALGGRVCEAPWLQRAGTQRGRCMPLFFVGVLGELLGDGLRV